MCKNQKTCSLHFRRKSLGFTLLEITAVLLIITVLMAGIMLLFVNSSNSEKANESVSELVAIVASIHSSYSGMPDYDTLTDARSFSRVSNIPYKWRLGQDLVTPFGKVIDVTNDNAKYIVITFPGIPNPACVRLLVNDYGPNLVASSTASSIVYTSVLTPSQANQACNSSTNSNTITWKFL